MQHSQQALELNRRQWVSHVFHSTRGRILLTKYDTFNHLEDLDSAIDHLRKAVELAELNRRKPMQAKSYHYLSIALRVQFEKLQELSIINRSIKYAQEALLALPRPHRGKAAFEFEYARSLCAHYKISGEDEKLQQAAELAESAVEGIESDHVDKVKYFEFLATVMKELSREVESPGEKVEETVPEGAAVEEGVLEEVVPKKVVQEEVLSIHPVPEKVSREKTKDIITQEATESEKGNDFTESKASKFRILMVVVEVEDAQPLRIAEVVEGHKQMGKWMSPWDISGHCCGCIGGYFCVSEGERGSIII